MNLIKQRREELKLSQEAFAQKLGVWPLTISRWENNDRPPQRRYWPRLAKFGIHFEIRAELGAPPPKTSSAEDAAA